MPIPIPSGKQIIIQKNVRPAQYCMPYMEISTDHYDISYIITGDRKVITPLQCFEYHTGDVAMGIPYLYHRTFSKSNIPYENYLIKFTPKFIQPFINQIGKNIFNELNEQRICSFSNEAQIKIKHMFKEMLDEYNKNLYYKEVILQGMLFRLLTTIYENKINTMAEQNKSPLTKSIIDTISYIDNNYNKDITLEKAAKTAHFSTSYFSKLFSSQIGVSFTEYLIEIRIKQAKKLLIQTNKSIMEIALDIGYCNGDYLSFQFKNKTGLTPSQFRHNYNKGNIT